MAGEGGREEAGELNSRGLRLLLASLHSTASVVSFENALHVGSQIVSLCVSNTILREPLHACLLGRPNSERVHKVILVNHVPKPRPTAVQNQQKEVVHSKES